MGVMEDMVKYFEDFLEKPHPSFGNLPVCPFIRKARRDGTILFKVMPFSTAAEIEALLPELQRYQVVTVIHPDRAISVAQLNALAEQLTAACPDYVFFTGHPQDDFQINGVYTHREPYPNVQAISKTLLEDRRSKLRLTRYYDLWNAKLDTPSRPA